ncbi:MAG: helix-turn-helix domain-containing protein [Armatimonadetes bacterium]|nr:helix-turn-helix domain-containing protein [Armatimonadota bacterium]
MSRHATTIVLTPEERAELERRVRARTSSQQAAVRARIVLRAAEGEQNQDIAVALHIARHTVQHWRDRFAQKRLPGLEDRPHCPPPRLYGPERQAKIVLLACQSPASQGWAGQTHWSIVDLAQYIGEHPELDLGTPSKSTVGKILQAHNIRLERL